MEGRWTISSVAGHPLAIVNGPPTGDGRLVSQNLVPVVPCDDAAIERAVEELIGAPYDWRTYSPTQVVDVVSRALAGQTSEEIADAYLRAAGETP